MVCLLLFLAQERLDSELRFRIPDDKDGSAGDFAGCSIKDLKHMLRKLGVQEEQLVKCVEKSDLNNLMALVSQVITHTYIFICVILPISSHPI